jgi:uncharacterized protein (TIGR03435 family)
MKKHIVTLLVIGVVRLTAQDAQPHFEVASVKKSAPDAPYAASGFQPGGRFVGRNMTGQRLLLLAFRDENGQELRPEQFIGAPSWMSSTRFDIDARVAGPATAERLVDPQAAELLRSLLTERFKLQVHREERELPFYALTIDKADGSVGPSMKPSTIDCDAIARERDAAQRANRAPAIPASTPGRPLCALMGRPGTASGAAVPMRILTNMLANLTRQTVFDRTGLTGGFDLELRYESPSASPDTPSDAPSIFTAVREQLGLRLEQRREPREVVVIDYVEQPTPN